MTRIAHCVQVDQILKDAPLPVKILGGMLKPLVGAFEGMIRESAADADDLLFEAGRRLRLDPRTKDLSLGSVFSSASSSSSINGVVQKQVSLQCQVMSQNGAVQGSALLNGSTQATGKFGLSALRVQLNDGRVIDLGGANSASASNSNSGVIDVDFAEG